MTNKGNAGLIGVAKRTSVQKIDFISGADFESTFFCGVDFWKST